VTRFVAFRLLGVLPVLIGASIFSFLLAYIAPGDITTVLLGPYASPEERAALRSQLGLDQSLPRQYLTWLGNVLHGDLGTSIQLREPVLSVLGDKFANTLILGLAVFVLALVLGVGGGVLSAIHYGGIADRGIQGAVGVLAYVPVFWLGVLLIYVFSLRLQWLPSGGLGPVGTSPNVGQRIEYLILPTIASVGIPAAIIAKSTRASVYDQLGADFVRTARAKGLAGKAVLWRHVFRVAVPSILHISGLQFAYLLGGSIVFTEVVFNWPGIGLQVYNAVSARDLPVIQGVVLLTALVTVVINLAVDVLHALVDPRLQEPH